jgi:hypothetical protein
VRKFVDSFQQNGEKSLQNSLIVKNGSFFLLELILILRIYSVIYFIGLYGQEAGGGELLGGDQSIARPLPTEDSTKNRRCTLQPDPEQDSNQRTTAYAPL